VLGRMFVMALAMITNYWLALVGIALVLSALYGWSFEPVSVATPEQLTPGHTPIEAPRAAVPTH